MMLSKEEFLNGKKSVTLIGMSGVGKTYISQALAKKGWECFSCDYEIGVTYLKEEIQQTLGIEGQVTVENLSYLSQFVGQLGNPELGGLPMDEFLRRQKIYYEAECASILDACKTVQNTEEDILIDSTGSLCEIEKPGVVEALGKSSLFVYLKASPEEELTVIQRAQDDPKPLFFPPALLPQWIELYMQSNRHRMPEDIVPNDFSRWVFPRLLTSRLPKYQFLADQYGITIPTSKLQNLSHPDEFTEAVAAYLS